MSTITTPANTFDLDASLTALAAATDESEQTVLIEAALADLEPLHRSIASSLCRQFSSAAASGLADEIAQCVRMAAWKMLRQIAGDEGYLAQVGSYRAVLTVRASRAAADVIDGFEGRSQSRGEVSLRRRLSEAARTREALIREGITNPTNDHVIERTNARMNASRCDAARQGMLLKKDDFVPVLCRTALSDYDAPANSHDEHYDLTVGPGEAKAMIASIFEALASEDARRKRPAGYVSLVEVAQVWLASATSDLAAFDRPATTSVIAADLGLPLTTAKDKVEHLRRVAAEVALQYTALVDGDARITGLPVSPAPAPLVPEPAAAEVVEARFGVTSAPLPTAA